VKGYHEIDEYQKSMRKRGIWVEPLFGEAKQFHQLMQFRLRRLKKVNIEGLLVAAGQNLKRLLEFSAGSLSESPSFGVFRSEIDLFCPNHWARIRLLLILVNSFSTG
jgi:hypothetical protein